MITVKWLGPEREVPGYGMGRKGKTITVPDGVAKNLIGQGMAEAVKKAKTEKQEK